MRRHTHIIAIALILSICCCIFTACGKSATPSDTPSTTQSSEFTTESTQPSETTQPTQTDHNIMIYVPENRKISHESVVFSYEGPWTFYLVGVENPDDVVVLDWTLIEMKKIDDGLVKLVVNNTKPDGDRTIRTLEGKVLIDGGKVLTLHDGTPY